MKIGIITFHRSQNYGAQLQAYATRYALEKLGHTAEVIDCNTVGEAPLFNWSFHSIKAIAGSIRNNVLALISDPIRNRLFTKFSRSKIGLSKPCLTKEALDKQCKQYDYVITGSDQVWCPLICEQQTLFYLDLPINSNQKIAYAPSFGVPDYTDEEVKKYMHLINNIKHLSVREESGQQIIKKYLGRKAELVVDPTMLLSVDDWNIIAKPSPYRKYLFYFTILDEQPGTDSFVREIAKERNLKIVRIGGVRDIFKKDFINARANGPQEFLGLVRDADCVVTSSFHGTVFSILYNKQFLSVCNNNNRNSRLITLTKLLGVEQRLVEDVKLFNKDIMFELIDYSSINARLNEMRNESLRFIVNSISNEIN